MSKPDKKAANQKPGKIVLLPVEQIEPSPFQARTAFDETEIAALAVSILQNGLLQPISVRKTSYHKYQLVAGERRLRPAAWRSWNASRPSFRTLTTAKPLRWGCWKICSAPNWMPLMRQGASGR